MRLKVTIPDSLKDIKLSQYQKFYRTTKDSEDDAFVARQMVGIFCNLTDEAVNLMKATDFNQIVSVISKVLKSQADFIQRFKMDGVEYGFIPKLDDITVGEKADLDNYLKEVDTMHKAMAVLYRPITSKSKNDYLIEDYKGDGSALDVSLDIAFGATFFLQNLMSELLNYTLSYIEGQVVHNTELRQNLDTNGVGINQSMQSLREISLDLTKWLK